MLPFCESRVIEPGVKKGPFGINAVEFFERTLNDCDANAYS